MDLVEVYSALGQERCRLLVRAISIGALRTYGVYEAIKIRSRLRRLNRQKLRASSAKLWKRITEGDQALAHDLSQAVLVSNIPLIVEVLDLLGIEHDENGFYARGTDHSKQLGQGWPDRVCTEITGQYPNHLLLLYINHLGWETGTLESPFLGSASESPAVKPG